MRILIVGPRFVGQWTEGTQKAFNALGHDASVFYTNSVRVEQLSLGLARRVARFSPPLAEWLRAYRTRWEHAMNRRLLDVARSSLPDLILVLKGETLTPATVADLRDATKTLAAWWGDDPLKYESAREQLPSYHAVFMFDRSYFPALSQIGVSNLHYLPNACDAGLFRPMSLGAGDRNRYHCDIAFVGVYYPERGRIIRQLEGRGLGIWGPYWDGHDASEVMQRVGRDSWRGKFVDQTTAAKIYNASSIGLNIHHGQCRLGGLNARTFEVLACGAFVLTDHVPGLEDLLIPDEQVACYAGPDDVRSQVEYYLAHPDRRRQISERGRARVLSEHTLERRMKSLLQALHLDD